MLISVFFFTTDFLKRSRFFTFCIGKEEISKLITLIFFSLHARRTKSY